MELIFKVSAAAVAGSALGLVIKKINPELSLLLSVSISVLIFSLALSFFDSFKELTSVLRNLCKGSEIFIKPVLKCLAVAIVSKMSGDICRDSSQTAIASAIDFAGGLCALSIAMPLILSLVNMIGGFL